MAEKAQQEPTMEEILSSIRKIISDDGPPQDNPSPEPQAETVGFEMRDDDSGDLDDLDFDDDAFEATLPEDEAGVLEALTAEPEDAFNEDVFDSEPAAFEAADEAFDELPPLDDLSSFEIDEPQDDGIIESASFEAPEPEPEFKPEIEEVTAFEPEPVVEAAPEPVFATEPEPEPVFTEEPAPMAASTLTNDETAAAAAGSLSKLLSKVEFGEEAGGNNTIEGLVREMLRPMLKEWLDENLAGIVDKHVEAEVKRIASRAG
ncbi:MAG: DUF2497 domain-containing protein [Pseudomonadota bacterium]